MQIKVEIDRKLLAEAQSVTGLKTEKDVIEAGLRALVQLKRQEAVKSLRGKLRWEGDLNSLRENRGDYDVAR